MPGTPETTEQDALAEHLANTSTPASIGAAAGPPPKQGGQETALEAEGAISEGPVAQARRFIAAPSGFLGESAGGLAIVLGIGTALGLAGVVLGLWIWQVRRVED